jgi:membrane-bound lytic murein transglycosylase B
VTTEKGKAKLKEIRPLLVHIYKKYGVQPSILVAFWGLETNYGKHVGKMQGEFCLIAVVLNDFWVEG